MSQDNHDKLIYDIRDLERLLGFKRENIARLVQKCVIPPPDQDISTERRKRWRANRIHKWATKTV